MTLILFLIFAIIIFGVMLVLSFVKGISSLLFGKSSYSNGNKYYEASNQSRQYEDSTYSSTSTSQKKVFSKHEGEYVPYEEIKE